MIFPRFFSTDQGAVVADVAGAAPAVGEAAVITKPASVQEGDILIAFAGDVVSTSNPDLPTGFTQLAETTLSGLAARVGTRVATGSEPTSYTFPTQSGSSALCSVIMVLKGVTQTPEIGAAVNASSVTGDITVPSVTATERGVLIMPFFTQSNTSTGGVISDDPEGIVRLLSVANGTSSPFYLYIYAIHPSATGTKAAKVINPSDRNTAFSFQAQFGVS